IKAGLNSNFYTLEPIAGCGRTGSRRPPGTAKILFDVFSGREIEGGAPAINFSGYTIGSPTNNPQRTGEHNYQIRDDFATAFDLGGRHDVKLGGDAIKYTMSQAWCNVCDGRFTSTAPPPANLEQLLPVWNDASRLRLSAERQVGHPRGLGTVLHRARRRRAAPVVHPHPAGHGDHSEQWPRGLRSRSVRRPGAGLRAAAREGLRRGEPAEQLAELLSALDPERIGSAVRGA